MKISRDRIIILFLYTIPVFAVTMPKAIAAIAAVWSGLSLCLLIYEKRFPQIPRQLLMFIPGIIWCALSITWSISPADSVRKLLQIVGIFVSVVMIYDMVNNSDKNSARSIYNSLRYSLVLICLLAMIDFMSNGFITIYLSDVMGRDVRGIETYVKNSPFLKNAAVIISVTIWPVIVSMNVISGVIFSAMVMITLVTLGSNTALFAFLVGLTIICVYKYISRNVLKLISIFFLGLVFVMPVLPKLLPPPIEILRIFPVIPNSMYHRLSIWEFTADKISQKPIIGFGMDTARAMPEGKDQIIVTIDIPGRTKSIHSQERLPLHPHNSILQWWLELGAIGAILFAIPIVYSIYNITNYLKGNDTKITAAAMSVSAITISTSSYGIWQSWWLSLIGIYLVMLLIVERNECSG